MPTKTRTAVKHIKHHAFTKRFSPAKLIAFIIIFGAIGGYVIIHSFAATPAGTANLWIDLNGGSCTRQPTAGAYVDAQACGSIQAAAASASTGDVIGMKAGSYSAQNVTAVKSSPGITVIADAGTTVSSLTPTGAWIEFQNLNVSSGLDLENNGASVPNNITFRDVDWTGGWWLSNCCNTIKQIGGRIHNVSAASAPTGIMLNGDGSGTAISNVTLDGVEIDHITHTVAGSHFEAVRIQGWVSNVTIRNSYFHDNGVNSSQIFLSSFNGGASHTPGPITIEGNKFDPPVSGAGDSPAFFDLNGNMQGLACPSLTVRQNTSKSGLIGGVGGSNFWNCTNPTNVTISGNISPVTTAICDATYSNNLFIASTSKNCGTGDQTVASTSAAGLTGDGFHITSTSVAKDHGGATCPSVDIDGDTRPQGAACDAGADEYVSAPDGQTANIWVSTAGTASCSRSSIAALYNVGTACNSLSAAYAIAQNGDSVIIKSGSYGSQSFPRRSALDGGTCVSSGNSTGCVKFTLENGATVSFGGLSFGTNYSVQGSSNISIDASQGTMTAGDLDFEQAHEIYLKDIKVPGNVYMTGGSYITVMGGEYGPFSDGQGTHPEIQAVYNSNPVIMPTHIKFSGGYWHDYNTTNASAHVDCLQIESGSDFTLENSRFNNCGSVGVRVSYGTNRNSEAPDGLLIQNNVFDKCANIPVSQCFYSAELGNGNNIVVRNNTFLMAQQPTTGNGAPSNVKYIGNAGELDGCQTFGTNISYAHNVWHGGTCNATDTSVTSLLYNADGSLTANSPAIGKADASNYPAYDILGISRPQGSAPDAGAYEYSSGGSTLKQGDLNGDNVVNIFDLSILLSHYGQTGQTSSTGDLNNDSVVNIFDLSILLSKYGT